MAGIFLLGERKIRPGAYFRRERAGFTVEGAINGIVAAIFHSNWGPLNEVVFQNRKRVGILRHARLNVKSKR